MAFVTEVAILPVLEGAEITKPIEEFIALVAKQPGFQNALWGRQVEKPDNVQVLIGKNLCDNLSVLHLNPCSFPKALGG
jgi:hypothetical protein